MKEKYRDFIKVLISTAKKVGKNKEDRLEFSQGKMFDGIRNFFEYKTEKTVKETTDYFYKEGYLNPSVGGFVLTEKAKQEFW